MQQTPVSSRRAIRRRALSLLLALALALGLIPGFPGAPGEASAHWADPYLSQLVEWGFIRADQANSPDRALTRADFMAIVNRAYGYHEPGATPFTDVSETDWYYDDVGIAYTARYINGTSPTTASPNSTLDRETATTILGRNMMLQESAGEILDFTDARRISTWAQGTIKSSLEHYLVSGYDDGTFRPQRAVSWGEMAALISRTIGTPLQEAGDYSLGGVFGNVTVTSPGVTLRDTVISGDLYITGGVGLGGIKLENVTVLGRIIASGTGASEGGASILLRNVTADELLVDNLQGNEVSIRADGVTEIGKTTVRTSAYIEDNTPEGLGLHMIILEGDFYGEGEEAPEGWEPPRLTLAGRIEEVINKTPNSTIHAASGTVAKLTIDEEAVGSRVIIDRGTVVKNLILDTGVSVTGEGDIIRLEVNAPGCEVVMLPDEIEIRPGITAFIAGEEMDSVGAKESSEQPMILAGYPEAQDIVPTGLDAVFMTNKSGTVYWAVSPITDGSIGEEDLIKPPSYGNVAVRNGSVRVLRGNEETLSKVAGLTPGGSYYLSAVLVDARGQRSTVKVISFTTPDNTKPAFCAGYPHMSSVGTGRNPTPEDTENPGVSQAVVMPTKDCKLYYALLPQGAVAPTENELKTSAVAGALGYGVIDVYKNTETVFRVHDQTLDEKTTYVLYLWLVDANGANKSAITSLTFTTDDETPPVFITEPTVTKVDKTSVTMTFRLNEDGIVYWVAIPANTINYPKPEPGTDYETAPPNSLYGMLQIENGMNTGADGKSGRVNCKGNADGTITVSGMKAETAYDFYYMAKDTAGNYTEIWKKITINPLDTNGPKFFQSFSDSSSLDGKSDPRSNTAIYLDVSEDVRYAGEGGGTSFLALYQAVKDARTEADKNAARNKLAANLYGAIKLHKINLSDNSEETIVSKWQTSYTGDNWTIDYTQATVESHEGGIRITFPRSGLHLENGGEYYFTITNVTDISTDQNPLVPYTVDFYANEALSKAAGHSVPVFIVEFARVDFSTPGVGAGDAPLVNRTGTVTNPDDESQFVRVDMSFRLTPVSTSTVADSISYDLLLWTRNVATFDLYYRVVDPSGGKILQNGTYPATYTYKDPNTQETITAENYLLPRLSGRDNTPDANGWIHLGNSGDMNPSGGNRSGRSVNKQFNGCGSTSFPRLNRLNNNLRYEFIIHLTSLDDIPEVQNGNETWRNWNGEVRFYANVAVGQSDNLDNLGGSLTDKNWEDAKKKGLNGGAMSIGRNNTREEPIDTQTLSRLFTDSRLPRFEGDAPNFIASSNSVDVNLRFSTAGTLYYIVGKADTGQDHLPEITTTRTLLSAIVGNADPEGTPTTSGGSLLAVRGGNNTYNIRMSDVASNGAISLAPTDSGAFMQNWMVGGIKEGLHTDDPEKENLVVNPQPRYVFNPKGQAETATAISGTFPFQGRIVETLTINKLESETDYFIYFVLKGEADTLSHVYIYHFKTPKADKPKIDLGNYVVPNSTDKGGATIKTDIDSKLQYFVFTRADAEDGINLLKNSMVTVSEEYYNRSGNQGDIQVTTGADGKSVYRMTALNALLNTYMGEDSEKPSSDYGFSVFDVYAEKSLKTQMSNFLHGRYLNTFLGTVKPVDQSSGEIDMKANVVKNQLLNIFKGTDYVILAVAHVPKPNSTDEAEYESYAGYAPIRLGAATPPEVDFWYANLQMGKKSDQQFNGAVYITFDTQLYAKNDRKTVLTNANITEYGFTQNWKEGVADRVKINVDSTDPQQTTLKFEGNWQRGDMIMIPGSKFFNVNGTAATSMLIINVDEAPNGSGMQVKLEWRPAKKPETFTFPFKSTTTAVSVNFESESAPSGTVISGGMGNQTLTVPAGANGADVAVKIVGKIMPSSLDCSYTWSSSNQAVATVQGNRESSNSGNARATLTCKAPGTTTIRLRLVGTDSEGNEVDETFDLTVVVYGISLYAATGAGSVSNGSLVWDLSKSASGSKLTIRSSAPLDSSINVGGADIVSNGKVFEKSGAVTCNDTRTEVYISIIKTGNTPADGGTDKITVKIGTLTCEFFVSFTGSESNLPIGGRP